MKKFEKAYITGNITTTRTSAEAKILQWSEQALI